MTYSTAISASVPSLILLVGIIEDIKSRKVRNSVVLACAFVGLAFSLATGGWNGMVTGAIGLSMAFILFLPLVALRILGAGDMKLMMAFGLACDWKTVASVFVYALIWGAILGVVRSLISGQFIRLLKNTLRLSTGQIDSQSKELQLIPYTVALAFGWLSHLFYAQGVLS